MTTFCNIILHAFGISKSDSDLHLHGSLQTVYGFTTAFPQQNRVRSSMKFIQRRSKRAFSPYRPIFQTWFMHSSDSRIKVVEASESKNGVISPAPEVGVAVFILKDDKVLFGRRRSLSIGGYTYGLPGGHLEFGETFEECATREVKEETGLEIKNIEFITATNICLYDSVHIVAIYMRAYLSDTDQTPKNIEPNMCDSWDWYDLKNLPEPMFGPLKGMLQGGLNLFPSDL